MRFRVAANQQATDSFGRGFANLFSAPMVQAQAAEEAQNAGMKRDLMASQIAHQVASTGLAEAQAAGHRAETTALSSAPDVLDTVLATKLGVDVPTLRAHRTAIQTGQRPTSSPMGDPELDAMIGITAQPQLDPALTQRLGVEYGRLAPAYINPKSYKVDDQAQASASYQKQDAVDAMVRNPALAALYGQGFAASEGKGLVENVGNTGRGFNKFTGQGGTLDAGLATLYDKGELAQVGQRNAAADASRASAEHSRASTRKVNQDINIGAKGVLRDTDQGLLLVNPLDGTSRPVLGPNGQAAGKATSTKPLPASAAKGHLDNIENLRRAQQALDLIDGKNVGTATGDAEATGWKSYLPNTLLNKVDPEGVDTRAAISDIGSMVIHDRSGAAVSASEFPRLAPFVPRATDDPETVKKKLKLFVQNYKAVVDDASQFYTYSGYHVPELPRMQAQTPPTAPMAGAAAGASGAFTYLGKE